jgi:hypothetical protein
VIAAKSPASPAVRPYDSSDQGGLDRLYGLAFGRDSAKHFFRRRHWEFERAPAITRFPSLVATRGRDVVAHLGLLPTRVAIGDEVVPAAFLTDFVADQARSGIVALQLVTKTLSELPLVLHFGGEPVAKQIFERLGMRPVPIAPMLLRVERPGGALAAGTHRYLRRRSSPLASWIRRWMFALPGALLMPFCARRYRWAAKLESREYTISQVGGFDARFDELGLAMRRQFPASCVRDRAFLDWRYRLAPSGTYTILVAIDAEGRLAAASVLAQLRMGPATYGKLMECLHRDEDALAAIINGSLAAFRRRGVDFVVSIGLSSKARELLREIGFRHDRDRPFRLKGNLSPELERILMDPAHWYISPGDGDEDFDEDTSV